MRDVVECGAVLFEDTVGEEKVRVGCVVTPGGELSVMQESDGPLTDWCFEHVPHHIEVVVDISGVHRLLEFFCLEQPYQLPMVLRLEYTGYECFRRVRQLFKRLRIGYAVREDAVRR